MKNKLDKADLERLVILSEECAELTQIICKVQRFGIDNYNPLTGIANIDNLIQELGDVICMIGIVGDRLEIPWEVLREAANKKKEKLKKFVSVKTL